FTTNDSVGLLVEGFDRPPVVEMPYNKPYYERIVQQAGLQPITDLYAYRFSTVELGAAFAKKAALLEERLAQNGIHIRPINFKVYKAEMERFREVYNRSNADNWGFVPLSREEFLFLADDLRKIVAPENVLLAYKGEQLVGFLVTLPDINQILIKIRNGRLLPFAWRHLIRPEKMEGARLLILGVLPEYRNLGIDACFYQRCSRFFQETGIQWAEACYVLQENAMMNRIIQHLKGVRTKTYRLYGCAVG
ncbi:MAG: hypothetical protein KDC44_23290, partial [Phaeodactylibacter sp.]|nr:hypothetical protein [Phaeodactylibacter sp.]